MQTSLSLFWGSPPPEWFSSWLPFQTRQTGVYQLPPPKKKVSPTPAPPPPKKRRRRRRASPKRQHAHLGEPPSPSARSLDPSISRRVLACVLRPQTAPGLQRQTLPGAEAALQRAALQAQGLAAAVPGPSTPGSPGAQQIYLRLAVWRSKFRPNGFGFSLGSSTKQELVRHTERYLSRFVGFGFRN